MSGRSPLWAPWRVAYIEGDRSGGCIFCEPAPPRSDRERLIVHRGSHVFVLLNRYPYAAGHLMVAPYAHTARPEELASEVQADLMGRVADAVQILQAASHCDGFNVGANLGSAAGAGFAEHLHFHVVPRWTGDVNYMTVIGETRVISKHLETSCDEIGARFSELNNA